MKPVDQRTALVAAAQARGFSLASLSRMLGRNPAYIHQYVERGSPKLLGEDDRRRLARFLAVDDRTLGGPEDSGSVPVARLDVAASAGAGALSDGDPALAPTLIDPRLLTELRVTADRVSMIRISGDSMAPTLANGDRVLVDTGTRTLRPNAIHIVRLEGVLVAKRLSRDGDRLTLRSDNPDWADVTIKAADAAIIGRVVWLSRNL